MGRGRSCSQGLEGTRGAPDLPRSQRVGEEGEQKGDPHIISRQSPESI